jgi:uncharacterized protein
MLSRKLITAKIARALSRSPIVALVGPRQVGKTTLAREFVEFGSSHYFDLEDPAALSQLQSPEIALGSLVGLVVIDEIQRRPDLFPVLRFLIDRPTNRSQFLLLGSASPTLLKQSSESLAGRIEFIEISPFNLAEVGIENMESLWLRGGYPRSWLQQSNLDSSIWREQFIQTFLERDLPQLGANLSSISMRKFWTMIAHYHGNILNASELGRSLSVSHTTINSWLNWLEAAFMVRQIQPWYANISKRQVKAPKIYVRDSGLLHQLLGIETPATLFSNPKVGASWEGFALEQVLSATEPNEIYFWATHAGAELDLIIKRFGKTVGIEFKRADAPSMSKSIYAALEDLSLDEIYIVYPGTRRYRLHAKVEVLPLSMIV